MVRANIWGVCSIQSRKTGIEHLRKMFSRKRLRRTNSGKKPCSMPAFLVQAEDYPPRETEAQQPLNKEEFCITKAKRRECFKNREVGCVEYR